MHAHNITWLKNSFNRMHKLKEKKNSHLANLHENFMVAINSLLLFKGIFMRKEEFENDEDVMKV